MRFWVCGSERTIDGIELKGGAVPRPGPNEVLIRHKTIGINFMDIHFIRGDYPNPEGRIGGEAAGVVEALGEGVDSFQVGDRVAYVGGPLGAYAEQRVIAVRHLCRLPDEIGFAAAAGLLLKGMTAGMLLTRLAHAAPLKTILVHAAAGGVGLLLGQWAHDLGIRAIGVVGGAEKKALAEASGYDKVVDRHVEDIRKAVDHWTGGKGVDGVFDGIGKASLETSMSCLAPRGLLVCFGAASGPVADLAIAALAPKALFVTRPTLTAYTATPEALASLASDVFDRVARGALLCRITTYPFEQAREAVAALSEGRTSGSLVLEL